MTVHLLADRAAALRSETLRFARGAYGHDLMGRFLDDGQSFTMPARWSALDQPEQVRRILSAMDRRVATGDTFAMSAPIVDAVKAVAQDRQVRLPLTEDLLPSPSGMLVAETPLCDLQQGWTMSFITWGPPLEGFGPGVHLTWWGAPPEGQSGETMPCIPDFDLHLPFAPLVDARLVHTDVPSAYLYSQVPLRTVVASWYALSSTAVETTEQRPQPLLGRALAAQKAKRRGVRVVEAAAATPVAKAIVAQSTALSATLSEKYGPGEAGGVPSAAPTPASASHGVFDRALDGDLDLDLRHVAAKYRAASDYWHRLETGIEQAYPGIIARLEEDRARRHGEWPSWCWMPSILVSARLMQWYDAPTRQAEWDGSRVAAVGAYLSHGRHALLGAIDLPPGLPTDPAPVGLETRMPAPGVGLILRDGDRPDHHVIAHVDYRKGSPEGELALLTNDGRHGGGFRDLTRLTLFLTDTTMTAAVRATQEYYDWAAAQNGRQDVPSWDDADCVAMAATLGYYMAPLMAACTPDVTPVDAAGFTGRTDPASWPPEPGLLSEMRLWLVPTPKPR
ncbi:hypothetical protein [Streptomyces sp. CC208A]|uniref:hypothetical protein n=1 Tax=Streptomyces sp. CC208A TaxID=3044573 RepID=UPI0024A9DD23|nr:hypothetical protein [Streptomyces sp. CC208A]